MFQGVWFRVYRLGLGFMVNGLGLRVNGLGLKI
jgi:hypothetical protein